MTDQGPIRAAFERSIQDAPLLPRDEAGAMLARHLADLIDGAEATASHAAAVLADVDPEDTAMHQRVRLLADLVEPYRVAERLAPKLKDVIVALRMAPGARKPAEEVDHGPVPGADELAALREERARERRA